ncbi:Eco57I restriction-modification methylase domain-containing protein [Brenneria goodwinii]|uniref:Eco57I restriction-modification methylase domain-containing protein n=1 Tax=Brenneria goodwinii TaxID=1109412 RepID=UPI0036EE2D5C
MRTYSRKKLVLQGEYETPISIESAKVKGINVVGDTNAVYLDQVSEAQSYCYELANNYWKAVKAKTGTRWDLRAVPIDLPILGEQGQREALAESEKLKDLTPEEAGYRISLIYQNSLPKFYREKLGIYYTPVHVVNRMLKDADALGINFKTARIIDPSSGGAAYLAPLCRKMLEVSFYKKQSILEDIENRLVGIEIDNFAAWFSQFLVDCVLAEYAPYDRKPKNIVINEDALQIDKKQLYGSFDYVIGNPPYGIIEKKERSLEGFEEVISGKVNLYQLFFAVGLSLVKEGGCLHFVTPTGYLGGKYFCRLRKWIENNSYPVFFQFFEDRTSIFKGVQQEIVISAFKKQREKYLPQCVLLKENEDKTKLISKFNAESPLFENGLWILPKSALEKKVSKVFLQSKNTLETLGFSVKTGYLVPHRSGDLISFTKKSASDVPILWSESISAGYVDFETTYKKIKQKWYHSKSGIGVISEPCVVVKRTSSKEQKRRIQAGYVSKNLIELNKGFIAENHVNVIFKIKVSKIQLSTLTTFLRSEIFEELFKCSSGTVTVSATELRQIPMPSYDGMLLFQDMTARVSSQELINKAAVIAYGM